MISASKNKKTTVGQIRAGGLNQRSAKVYRSVLVYHLYSLSCTPVLHIYNVYGNPITDHPSVIARSPHPRKPARPITPLQRDHSRCLRNDSREVGPVPTWVVISRYEKGRSIYHVCCCWIGKVMLFRLGWASC